MKGQKKYRGGGSAVSEKNQVLELKALHMGRRRKNRE